MERKKLMTQQSLKQLLGGCLCSLALLLTAGIAPAAAQAPTLTSLSTSTVAAGSPAFTLILHGTGFTANSTGNWSGTTLATKFVSDTKIDATVPAKLLTRAVRVEVTVVDPSGTSNGKIFTITVTSIGVKVGTILRDPNTGVLTVPVTLKNNGHATAPATQVTNAQVGSMTTTSTLPVVVGDLAAGATASVTLTFPGSAGASGANKKLVLQGTYTGGTFYSSQVLTLP